MAKKAIKKIEISDKYNRNFSEDFKKSKVSDLEKGLISIKLLCEHYQISRTSVYKWVYLYSNVTKGVRTVVQMESEEFKTKLLAEKVCELERIIGQKQIEIDYLNKLIEIESESIGYNIKKKAEQMQLNGLDLTKKKELGK